MQDVDRPAHVQALPEPARARCPRVEAQPLRVVLRAEGLDRIGGDQNTAGSGRPQAPERERIQISRGTPPTICGAHDMMISTRDGGPREDFV